MKSLLRVLLITFMLFGFILADIIPIASVQDTTGSGSDASALVGEIVTITGTISAESWAYGNKAYFVQDAEAKWSGIYVYDSNRGNAYGDSVMITATVAEYYGLTQLKNVTEYVKLDSGKTVNPIVVTTGEIGTGGANAEAYEGVLVRVENANITNPDANYGQWLIDDGSGVVMVDDDADYYFRPAEYSAVKSVTGPLTYAYSDHKILPRLAMDVVEDDVYTRLQRIQQVRYSDLLKAQEDSYSDTSYFKGDTVKIKGVVTMPTGLSYAGAGIKFIFQEEEGGPWSSVLSYNSDSTAYPQLFEGDLIEVEGYIAEYRTGSANMTELFITSPINIINFGLELPPVDTVLSGDLIWPVTAEQWGNNIVCVKNAEVVDVEPGYELFAVDDGSGKVLVDDDSDSLVGYPDPPVGAILETIEGWIYHHYGSYETEDTYKICPLYVEDIVLGSGPPQLQNYSRTPGVPVSSDDVYVSIDVSTNGTISAVNIIYSVNHGAPQTAAMTNEDGNVYSGSIPPQADGSWVEYYIKAEDTEGKFTIMPADTSSKMYGYIVKDAGLTIADIQWSPWTLADSPFDKASVEVTGIVTADTSFKNNYGGYVIQDGSSAWNGIPVFGITDVLKRGDEIKVIATVQEYWDDYHYKYDNNTLLVADSYQLLSSGNAVPTALEVTTGELASNPEMYEGCLVKISNVQVTSINTYDWSVDDGSGACLIDDDASSMDFWFDSLAIGDSFTNLTGVWIFSFGTYKIEIRDMNDVGGATEIDGELIHTARSYKLEQNFPNPFNPSTRIYFEIPNTELVTIAIYNVVGQKVRTLEQATYTAGRYTLNWDGKDDFGASVPTGTYIYRMKAGNFIQSRKMLLMK
ncbi:MAG: T9SS type A sorting domain-containing protein [Candidatus Marinimicrobia bacterium]|nr:T9SS type A sorting domain-containing protein [Candidatus Neomarinimicrobiota bacterium]